MKIEIKKSDLDSLTEQIEQLSQDKKELEEKLSKLDPNKLKEDATELAWNLFESWVSCVFKSLGFKSRRKSFISSNLIGFSKEKLSHHLGESWWAMDRVEFKIEAYITQQFKEAFLKIGVVSEEKEQ